MADFNVDRFKEEASLEGISSEQIDLVLREEGLLSDELDLPPKPEPIIQDTLASGTGEFFGPPTTLTPNTLEVVGISDEIDAEGLSKFPSTFASIDVEDDLGNPLEFESITNNAKAIIDNLKVGGIGRDIIRDVFGEGIVNSTTGQAPVDLDSVNFVLFNMIKASGRDDVAIRFNGTDKVLLGINPAASKRTFKDVEVGFMSPDGKRFISLPESGFLDTLLIAKNEIGLGFGGAFLGGRTGALIGGELGAATGVPTLVGFGALAGASFGALAGGAGASAIGRSLDIMISAEMLRQDLNTRLTIRKAVEAGEDDMLFSVIGSQAVKATLGTSKVIFKSISKLNESILNKDLRAFNSLKDNLAIENEEVLVYTNKLRAQFDIKRTGNIRQDLDVDILSLLRSVPGGERILSDAISIDGTIATQSIRKIRQVSDRLNKAVKNSIDKRGISNLGESYVDFISKTNAVFSNVNSISIELVKEHNPNFRFNAKELLNEPLKKSLKGFKDTDTIKILRKKFDGFIDQADFQGLNSYVDLVTLRRGVNALEFPEGNKRLISEVRSNVLKAIDDEVTRAVKGIDIEGKPLGDIISKSKEDFADMKEISRTTLGAMLETVGRGEKPIEDKTVIEAVRKAFVSDSSDFVDVMSALPQQQRESVEIILFDFFRDKASKEIKNEDIINLVRLSDSVSDLPFETKLGKEFKFAAKALGDVLRNETQLASVIPSIQKAGEGSGVIQTLSGRGRIEMASVMFKSIRRFFPTKTGADINMVMKAVEVLKNPLSQKNLENLIKIFPKEEGNLLKSQIEALRPVITKDSIGRSEKPTIQIFRIAKAGQEFKKTEGELGKAVYYKRNVTKVDLKSGEGKVVLNILEGKIASEDVIRRQFNLSDTQSVEEFFKLNQSKVKDNMRRRGNTFIEIGDDLIDLN